MCSIPETLKLKRETNSCLARSYVCELIDVYKHKRISLLDRGAADARALPLGLENLHDWKALRVACAIFCPCWRTSKGLNCSMTCEVLQGCLRSIRLHVCKKNAPPLIILQHRSENANENALHSTEHTQWSSIVHEDSSNHWTIRSVRFLSPQVNITLLPSTNTRVRF